MLVFEKKCRVCAAIRKNKPLLKRIYESSYFVPYSKDNLTDIHRDYKDFFRYEGLQNHVKKHQFIDSQDYHDKMLQQVDKEAEKKAVVKAVKAVDAIQNIIEIGHERLKNEEITVDTNQLIRASQVKMTQEAKQKDQSLAMAEMVAHFLSGEGKEDRIYIDPENEVDSPGTTDSI